MKIYIGNTAENAIPLNIAFISDASQAAHAVIDQMFGTKDGSYFIMNESNRKNFNGEQYYTIFVEDKDKEKHTIFFKINIKT